MSITTGGGIGLDRAAQKTQQRLTAQQQLLDAFSSAGQMALGAKNAETSRMQAETDKARMQLESSRQDAQLKVYQAQAELAKTNQEYAIRSGDAALAASTQQKLREIADGMRTVADQTGGFDKYVRENPTWRSLYFQTYADAYGGDPKALEADYLKNPQSFATTELQTRDALAQDAVKGAVAGGSAGPAALAPVAPATTTAGVLPSVTAGAEKPATAPAAPVALASTPPSAGSSRDTPGSGMNLAQAQGYVPTAGQVDQRRVAAMLAQQGAMSPDAMKQSAMLGQIQKILVDAFASGDDARIMNTVSAIQRDYPWLPRPQLGAMINWTRGGAR